MSLVPNYGGSLPKQYRDAKTKTVEALGIPALYRMIMLAPSGSGKTNMAFHIIKNSRGVYAFLHVICRNPDQLLYDYLRDKLDGFIAFYDPDTAPNVDQIRRTPLSSKKPELVIFDDITTDKRILEKLVSTFYIRCRHYKLSSILLAHSLFALPKLIRLNSELCVILKANSKRDLQVILKDFDLPNITESMIFKAYNKCTAHIGQALVIDGVKGQLRWNFDKVLDPTEI